MAEESPKQTGNTPRDGGEALYRGWTRRIRSGRIWIYYIPAIIALLYLLMLPSNAALNPFRGFSAWRWEAFTLLIFFAVRIPAAAVPILALLPDLGKSSWPLLKATTLRPDELFLQVGKLCFVYAALPISIMLLLECVALRKLIPLLAPYDLIGYLLVFLILLSYAFFLVACGLIPTLKWPSLVSVFSGLLIPAVLSFLAAWITMALSPAYRFMVWRVPGAIAPEYLLIYSSMTTSVEYIITWYDASLIKIEIVLIVSSILALISWMLIRYQLKRRLV